MDDRDQIQELSKRVEMLEYMLSKISLNEAKQVILTNCPIGEIAVGNDCKIDFQNCSIGSVMDADIDEAEVRMDDLESRLEEVNDRMDETESRMNEIRDPADESI